MRTMEKKRETVGYIAIMEKKMETFFSIGLRVMYCILETLTPEARKLEYPISSPGGLGFRA